MPQDAFTLRHNASELRSLLVGGKINKIIQPNKDEVLLYIYTGKSLLKLIISTNASFCRVCVTDYEKEPLAVAPNFCMLLRKHLLGAEILDVFQVEFERIVAVKLKCTSDFTQAERVLYCEIMGKYSNVILTENGLILGALKSTSLETNAHRILFSGAKYTLPAPQDKVCPLNREKLAGVVAGLEWLENGEKLLFERVSGLAYPTAEAIMREYEKYGKNTGMPLADFIYRYIFEGETSPCILYVDGEGKEFSAKYLEGSSPRHSLQEAQDELYSRRDCKKQFEEKKRKLLGVVTTLKKKQEKRLSQILDSLQECEQADEYKKYGELITANLYRISRGDRKARVIDYYDPACGEITISLDEKLTPSQNAQKYYKKYGKLKRAVEALTPRLRAEQSDLAYTESVLSALSLATELADLSEIEEELTSLGLLKAPVKKSGKKSEEVPFRRFEKDGFTILAGRNNVQNDRLLKAAKPNDVWLHTQKYHSSHVVILTENRVVPDAVLEYAGSVCAYYSQGRGGNKIPVDYCERRFVKKPSKAKAGFVVYTDYKTMLVNPMEVE